MATNETLRRINLSSFFQGSLIPAAQFLESAGERSIADIAAISNIDAAKRHNERQRYLVAPLKYSQASFLETYFWLHLGVEIGFLPSDESSSVIRELFSRLKLTESTWNEISRLFPGPLRVIGDHAVIAGKFFSEGAYIRFQEPHKLHGLYQAALTMEQSFSGNEVAQRFTTALTFSLDSTWNELIRARIDQNRLLGALRGVVRGESSHETLLAGFFIALEHTGTMINLFSSGPKYTENQMDTSTMSRRIREICFWRFNLIDSVQKLRYFALVDDAAGFVAEEVRRAGVKKMATANVAAFRRAVVEIIDHWNNGIVTESKRGASAGATA
jgi:hypothetical protein